MSKYLLACTLEGIAGTEIQYLRADRCGWTDDKEKAFRFTDPEQITHGENTPHYTYSVIAEDAEDVPCIVCGEPIPDGLPCPCLSEPASQDAPPMQDIGRIAAAWEAFVQRSRAAGSCYSILRIYTDGREVGPVSYGSGPILVEWETNDNNDDGFPEEVAMWTCRYATLEDAQQSCGKRSRLSAYGNPIQVFIDDVEQLPGDDETLRELWVK